MAQHNSSLHHAQQQQSQAQQQAQQAPVVGGQQLVGTSVQLQAAQQSSGQSAVSQQNNNYPGSQQHAHFAQMHSGGVFMPPSGPLYHMIQPSLPGNVYVNNVTANVNLHGYSVPQYVQPFIPGDVPQGVQHGVEQVNNQILQPLPTTTSNRGSRRGRGRGGNNSSRRNDYIQRQQASPAPQEIMNPALDPQNMAPTGYPQFYQYYQPMFAAPPQGMSHPQAQQAAGPPLYVTGPVPVYAAGPQVFNYPIYMIPSDYQMIDDKVEEPPPAEGMMAPIWHPHMPGMEYSEEFLNPELVDDMTNHNASPMSSNTPSIMSPMFCDQTIEMQQQMSTMHLYDASSLSQQSLQSDEQVQENTNHHQMHEQMVPMMHEQMLNNGQVQIEEMQQILIEQERPPQMLPHIDQKIHVQSVTEVNETVISEGSVSHPIPITSVGNVPLPVPIHAQEHNIVQTATVPKYVNNSNNNNPDLVEQNVNNNNVVAAAGVNSSNNLVTDNNQNVPNVSSTPSCPEEESVTVGNTASVAPKVQQQLQHFQKVQTVVEVQPQPQHQQQDANVSAPSVVVDNSIAAHSNLNKTMSWTNPTKKNTTSVAITATPVSAGKTVSNNKTVTLNLNETPATQQPVQVKSHGVMKTPSSPVAASESVIEKKSNQSSYEPVKNVSTTSIASTVVPQQLQGDQKVPLQTQLPVESKKSNPISGHSSFTQNLESSTGKSRKDDVPTIVLPTPTPLPQAPQSQPGTSWASLFTSNGPAPGSVPPPSIPIPASSHPMTAHVKKPVAKVLPFEGTSNITPTPPPGGMSYSAASAQGLSSSNEQIVHSSKSKSSSTHSSNSNINNNALNTSVKGNVDDWSIKFADFLMKCKIDFSPVSLRPRGLTNCSNYCYINAILQSLIGCPPFYNLMKSIPKLPAAVQLEKTNLKAINAMIQLVNEFSHLPPGARLQSNRREKGQKKGDDLSAELTCDPAFTPHAIYKLWNDSRTDVVEGRQEDAEEFLGFVLNQINDEMLEIIKLIAKPSAEQNGEQNTEGDDGDDWQMIYNNRNKGSVTRQTDFGRTPLSDIFRGELRSRLQREGEHSTDDIQPFFTLQLNIEKAASVKEALEILVGRDQLEGVTCSKTNQEVNAWQQMTLEKLPVVLILHLKWFDYKPDGCTKILKTVEFPVELKIDTKILASKKYSQKQRLYRLFAVVYHDGKEASKGHYITDVFHIGYNNWLRFDDSSVKPVSEHNVLRPRAPRVPYLLYYRRCDTVSPTQQQQQQQQQPHQQQHHSQHNTNNK